MFSENPFKIITEFDWKDLHKKVGQIIYVEPTESDIAEGDFKTKVYFVDENFNMFLLKD